MQADAGAIGSPDGHEQAAIDRCRAILRGAGLLTWKRGGTKRANEYKVNLGPCKGSKRRYIVRPGPKEKGEIGLDGTHDGRYTFSERLIRERSTRRPKARTPRTGPEFHGRI